MWILAGRDFALKGNIVQNFSRIVGIGECDILERVGATAEYVACFVNATNGHPETWHICATIWKFYSNCYQQEDNTSEESAINSALQASKFFFLYKNLTNICPNLKFISKERRSLNPSFKD